MCCNLVGREFAAILREENVLFFRKQIMCCTLGSRECAVFLEAENVLFSGKQRMLLKSELATQMRGLYNERG